MAESMTGLKRTHRCAELSEANIGEKVTFLPGFTEYDGFFVAVLEKVW